MLLKLDLARAFNSISWPFLFDVLHQYGFGDRFLDWLAILLSWACTKVLLNGDPGPAIWHHRGLQQGDPLSPQLFAPCSVALLSWASYSSFTPSARPPLSR